MGQSNHTNSQTKSKDNSCGCPFAPNALILTLCLALERTSSPGHAASWSDCAATRTLWYLDALEPVRMYAFMYSVICLQPPGSLPEYH